MVCFSRSGEETIANHLNKRITIVCHKCGNSVSIKIHSYIQFGDICADCYNAECFVNLLDEPKFIK